MRRTAYRFASSSLVLLALGVTSFAHAADWPQWRGPEGQGHSDAKNLPATWGSGPGGKNVAWQSAIPGRGHSSPVIAGNHLWLTTAIDTPDTPENVKRRLKVNTGNQPLIVPASVSFRAVGVDIKTGKIVHDIELMNVKEPQWVHRDNSYATPSPIHEDGKLYAHFGTLGTACLDLKTRKVLWAKAHFDIMHENGPGSTPQLYGDHLIVHMDGSDKQFIAALNKKTGAVAWRTDRTGEMHSNPQLKKAYVSPLIATIDGKPQVISPGANWLYSYDPATGRQLWRLSYQVLGFSGVARPVVAHDMIYVCTGFMKGDLVAVKVKNNKPSIAWRHTRGVPKVPSPIVIGDALYFVSDTRGVLTCLDAKTGDTRWTQSLGGRFYSSPMYADGKLYLCDREGNVYVIKPGSAYKLIAKNKLDGPILASPVAIDGALFLRTEKTLYRLGE